MTWKRFEDIEVWQKAREISKEIRKITWEIPYIDGGMASQMNDSSGSLMDNIAEGFERGSNNEFRTFLGYSRGSGGELRSQLYRCLDEEYVSVEKFKDLNARLIQISKELKHLISFYYKNTRRGFRISGE